MKTFFAIMIFFVGHLSVAQVPRELQDLIPAGSKSLQVNGKSRSNEPCNVQMSTDFGFSALVSVTQSDGLIDPAQFARFQMGFGHNLTSLKKGSTVLTATSAHPAQDEYSPDSKSVMQINFRNGTMDSVRIQELEKSWFGYSTTADVMCFL
jgi:hypothetical protein